LAEDDSLRVIGGLKGAIAAERAAPIVRGALKGQAASEVTLPGACSMRKLCGKSGPRATAMAAKSPAAHGRITSARPPLSTTSHETIANYGFTSPRR